MAEDENVRMDVEDPGLDFSPRNNELIKIFELTYSICLTYGVENVIQYNAEGLYTPPQALDIDESNAIAGVLYNVFTYLRKSSNNANTANLSGLGSKVTTIGTTVLTTLDVVNACKEKPHYKEFDFVIATPLVNMLTLFKSSFDEIRTSCNEFTYRRGRIDSTNAVKTIGSFGLSPAHAPILTGLSFKPERRSEVIEAIGPLTLSLSLAIDKSYTSKIENALRAQLNMLPFCDNIITFLKEIQDPSSARGFFRLLGDTLLIIGSRAANIFYIPLYLFMYLVGKNSKQITKKTGENVCTKLVINVPEWFSFSGPQMMMNYSTIVQKLVFKKKSAASTDDIGQVVFHAIFGTTVKDLGLLAQITNLTSWKKRSELNSVFNKAGSQESKRFNLPYFKYFSKAAAANMLKNTYTNQPMLINKVVFAGKRKRFYSEAFINYLESGNQYMNCGIDVNNLTCALARFKEKLVNGLRIKDDAGTAVWFKEEDGKLVEVNIDFKKSGSHFYS